MIWQDIVIAAVGIAFGFILLPQLRDVINGQIINLYTGALTTAGLYILAVTFATLNLWITVFAELFVGTVWLLLFVFSYRNIRKQKTTDIST